LTFDSSGNIQVTDGQAASGTSVTATGTTTARLLADWFADKINVASYANTQAGMAAAVAAAYAAGKSVYWPVGTRVSTATIPNFHDVRHEGPGVVQRGSDLFYVDPSLYPGSTNILYVATTGSNTNDGLSSVEPRLTALATANVIYGYRYGDLTWKIQFAAGTFTEVSVSASRPFPTPRYVQFLGASVSRGVQPTTIFQATGEGVGATVVGFYFQNYVRAQVLNINFKNYRTNAVNANNVSTGLTADGRSDLVTDNVWTDNCDQGIYITNGSQARIQAGRHGFNAINGAGVQLIRHAQATVGYGGTLADVTGATGTAFIGGSYGVFIQEFSMAHTDFCYYNTQTQAGVLCNTGRVHSVSSTYLSCYVGIDCRYNANLGNTTNTFTTCTTDIALRSGSRNAGAEFIEGLNFTPPVKEIDMGSNSTSSVTPVTIYTKAFEAKELAVRGTGFELKLFGEVVGAAGTKTIVVTLGATTLVTAVIAAATTDYEIHVKFAVHTAASVQKVLTRILQNGVLGVRVLTANIAEDLTVAKTLTVTHQVANGADSNRIEWKELEIQH
jgi:hypothetical protein